MTTISFKVQLSPEDLRLFEKLRRKLEISSSETIARAVRLMAFNVGLMDHIESVEHAKR